MSDVGSSRWRRWFRADPRITDLAERRTVELVAFLLALMAAVSVAGLAVGAIVATSWIVARLPAVLVLLVTYAVLFGINRTRHHRIGAVVLALAPLVSNFLVGLADPADPVWYAFVPVSVILAGALLSLRTAVVIAGLCVAVTAAVVVAGDVDGSHATAAIGYVTMTSVLVLGLARFRRRLERERVAEVERLAQQLAATERLESIGRFAGGVAHDFNNLLTVILANAELARRGRDVPQLLAEIEDAATRAAGLTRQLLAFTRHRPAPAASVALDRVLHEMQPLLRRLVPEHIELELDARSTWEAVLDQPQLEQVILNLAANARDAMADGGTLRFETRDVPGGDGGDDHVRLTVSDSGTGMDARTRARALEPFFSTKPPGAGTGLGLATVDAIVRGAGGTIELDSAPGAGTTVAVSLRRGQRAARQVTHEAAPAAVTARGVALLVEDDPLVRAATERMLAELGLRVVVAANAAEVARALAEAPGPLALVVSDMVMPGKSGLELVEELRASHPGVPAVLMSGYSERGVPAAPHLRFVTKPFTVEELNAAITGVLDAAAGERCG